MGNSGRRRGDGSTDGEWSTIVVGIFTVVVRNKKSENPDYGLIVELPYNYCTLQLILPFLGLVAGKKVQTAGHPAK